MHLRIQMRKGRAVDALKRGLEDLVSLSDHVLEQFSREKQEFDAMFV
jgi:DNA-directed RNA polymerase subunit L